MMNDDSSCMQSGDKKEVQAWLKNGAPLSEKKNATFNDNNDDDDEDTVSEVKFDDKELDDLLCDDYSVTGEVNYDSDCSQKSVSLTSSKNGLALETGGPTNFDWSTHKGALVRKPEWMSSRENSYVSPGTLLKSKSGAVGSLSHSDVDPPSFGFSSVSPLHTSSNISRGKDDATGLDNLYDVGVKPKNDANGPNYSGGPGSIERSQHVEAATAINQHEREGRYSNQLQKKKSKPTEQHSCFEPSNSDDFQYSSDRDEFSTLAMSAFDGLLHDMSMNNSSTFLMNKVLKAREQYIAQSRNMSTRVVDAATTGPATSVSLREKIQSTSFTPQLQKQKQPLTTTESQFKIPDYPKAYGCVVSSSCYEMKTDKGQGRASNMGTSDERSSPSSQHFTSELSARSTKSLLLTNKQEMFFGCVKAGGDSVSQVAILRNGSATEILQIKIFLKHDLPGFKLDNLPASSFIQLGPQETFHLRASFEPPATQFYQNKIMFLPVVSRQKFSIRLNGFGGCADVIPRLTTRGNSFAYELMLTGTLTKFFMINTGSRDAFVKITAYSDPLFKVQLPEDVLQLYPSNFVLPHLQSKQITCSSSNPTITDVVAFLRIYWGEEIMRRRFKKHGKSLPAAAMVHDEDFNVPFDGEENVVPEYGCGILEHEERMFAGSIRTIEVIVMNSIPKFGDADSTVFLPVGYDETTCVESRVFGGSIITIYPEVLEFGEVAVGCTKSMKIEIRNLSDKDELIQMSIEDGPYSLKCTSYNLKYR
ncbi:unnamed protein product [Soboliphyme baturini]|uniref:ASH domain-containing protein n=1 Tax=Soboliphyme baturini TaxID=241478 RepID=A0A183ILA5_9BILA|nr:unnamed protein product [Soboliphyme baturini]